MNKINLKRSIATTLLIIGVIFGFLSCNKAGPGVFYAAATSRYAVPDKLSLEQSITDITMASDGSYYAVGTGRLLRSQAVSKAWELVTLPKGHLAMKSGVLSKTQALVIMTDYDSTKAEKLYSYNFGSKKWGSAISLPAGSQGVALYALKDSFVLLTREVASGELKYHSLAASPTALEAINGAPKLSPKVAVITELGNYFITFDNDSLKNEIYKIEANALTKLKATDAPDQFPIEHATLAKDKSGATVMLAMSTNGAIYRGELSGTSVKWVKGKEKHKIMLESDFFGLDKDIIIASPSGKLSLGRLSEAKDHILDMEKNFTLFDEKTREQTLLHHAEITSIKKVDSKLLFAGVSSSTHRGAAWVVDLKSGVVEAIQENR